MVCSVLGMAVALCLGSLVCAVSAAGSATFTSTTLTHPPSQSAAFPTIAARGDRVVASTVGPVLWASHDAGQTFVGPQTPNATGCTELALAGTDDVAVSADGALFAVQNCFALGGSILIWRSGDGGRSWAPPAGGRVQVMAVGMESAMITADPTDPRTLYVIGEALDLTTLIVWKSTDAGRRFTAQAINLPDRLEQLIDDGPSAPTRLLVDPSDPRRLYLMWWAIAKRELAQLQGLELLHDYEFATKAFAATSSDAGNTWRVRKIIDTGGPAASLPAPRHDEYSDLANWFPAGAIDSSGTVYFAVAEQRPHTPGAHVMLMSSRDHGQTWSERIQVDAGPYATFAPAVVAGSAGRVGIAFLQADRPVALDPQARWSEQYVVSDNADSPRPRFVQSAVTGPLVTGAVCPLPDGPHSCRTRTLSIASDGGGRALILGTEGTGTAAKALLSRQVAGPTLIPSPVRASTRMRLTVRPRIARAGRRTALRFEATSVQDGARRPAAGARIRFIGRTMKTNRRGRARISVRFRAPGSHRARVTKRGLRADAATVRVVR